MYPSLPRTVSVASLLTCLAQPIAVHADTVTQATLSLTSDRVYHGLSESTENPGIALQSEVHTKRWFVGATAELSRPDATRERHQAATGYFGLDQTIGSSGWLAAATAR